ncbi:hypothetical protein Nepgr_008668 [Nepenthes gracilis]|uniref:Uncharacterized protein n=1 Tax=Nepenthes gracilis TaxID=150966 RepID=A0AAD3S938_NEPGR|nr:hypothetical protein Nepgr_008668 [Nepenthes gracilis]
MGDEVAIVPHNEMWLPRKICKRFPPVFSSTDSNICAFLVVDLEGYIWSTKIKNVFHGHPSLFINSLSGKICNHESRQVVLVGSGPVLD